MHVLRPTERSVSTSAEIGLRYKLKSRAEANHPDRIGVGYWYDANPFPRIDNNGSTDFGTTGAYILFDQLLWKPRHGNFPFPPARPAQ